MQAPGFSPRRVTVPVGATIRWTNPHHQVHTITSDEGHWDSGPLAYGQSYFRKFHSPGEYLYHSRFDPKMKGIIVVAEQ